jgi:hypothetical protein
MPYFRGMRLRRFLSILALFAVLLAPAGMLGSHAAMAMPAQPSASGHCSEQQQHDSGEQKQAMIDCAIACTALPSHQPMLGETGVTPAAAPEAGVTSFTEGTRPEAATPPPRIS